MTTHTHTPDRLQASPAILEVGDRVSNVTFPNWGNATVTSVQTDDGKVYVAARYDHSGEIWSGVQSAYRMVSTESNVPTSDLANGDVVHAAVGPVRLVIGSRRSYVDHINGERHGMVTRWDADILYPGDAPAGSNISWARSIAQGEEHDWTVQGNDLARWTREI